MYTKRWAMMALVMLFSGALQALEAGEVQCTDRAECWPEGSAMRAQINSSDGASRWDRLNMRRLDLISTPALESALGLDLRKQLLSEYAAWIQWRDKFCSLQGNLTLAGGAWPGAWAAECRLAKAKQRNLELKKVQQCLKHIPNLSENSSEIADCFASLSITQP